MRWHPFAERFPLLEGEEWESFKESVRESGGNQDPVTYRMVGDEKEYLDGRNRARACLELGLRLKEECRLVADADVKAFILRRNLHRRHLTAEARRGLAAELRADGQSTRQIAEALGVGQTTVVRDLKAAGEPFGSPDEGAGEEGSGEPFGSPDEEAGGEEGAGVTFVTPDEEAPPAPSAARVTGKDGKSYPAAKAPAPAPQPKGRLCGAGIPIPPGLLKVWASVASFSEMIDLLVEAQQMIHALATSPGGEVYQSRLARQAKGKGGALRYSCELVTAAIEKLRASRPFAAACPRCRGRQRSCAACGGRGWVTREAWDACPAEWRKAAQAGRENPERQPGDDTEQIEAEAAAERELPRPGSVLFDWKEFDSAYGALLRQVDKLGRGYRRKESQSANSLREQLRRFHEGFKSWHADLTLTGAGANAPGAA